MATPLDSTLRLLGLSDATARVYHQLLSSGPQTARQLAERLSLPRPSVYDHLKLLMGQGLVVERDQENVKVFQVDDVRRLPQLVQDKITELQAEAQSLERDLPSLLKQSQSIEPRMKFYPGVKGVKQVLSEALWQEKTEILSLWPVSEMIAILGRPFHENFHRQRIRRGISLRTIWPPDRTVSVDKYPYLGTGKKFLRQLRLAPAGMSWDMGYVLYGNKAGFISPQREAYSFTLQSSAFAHLMRLQFEILWKLSTPVKTESKRNEEFLKTL